MASLFYSRGWSPFHIRNRISNGVRGLSTGIYYGSALGCRRLEARGRFCIYYDTDGDSQVGTIKTMMDYGTA